MSTNFKLLMIPTYKEWSPIFQYQVVCGTQRNTLPYRNQILYILIAPQGRNTFQAYTQDIDNANTLLY